MFQKGLLGTEEFLCVNVHLHTCMYVCREVGTHACMCIHIYVYIYIHIHIYIHILCIYVRSGVQELAEILDRKTDPIAAKERRACGSEML